MTAEGRRSPGRPRSAALDDRLVELLASGTTLVEAARITGCSERTARRRWADPSFRARVQAASDDAMVRASALLAGAARNAALRLVKLSTDADSQSVQLRAAS